MEVPVDIPKTGEGLTTVNGELRVESVALELFNVRLLFPLVLKVSPLLDGLVSGSSTGDDVALVLELPRRSLEVGASEVGFKVLVGSFKELMRRFLVPI